jgi:hypothetical protein
MMQARDALRLCPLCRVAMIGRTVHEDTGAQDFECPFCHTVVTSKTTLVPGGNEPAPEDSPAGCEPAGTGG